MAAATHESPASRVKDGEKLVEDTLFELLENRRGLAVVIPFADKVSLATTEFDEINDIKRLSPLLPAGTYIWEFRGTPSDLDTDGSPTHVYDIIAVSTAGVTIATLVSGSTKSQAASGSDRMLDAAAGKYVGQCYLAMKTTTAPTAAAAGTYKLAYQISVGVCKPGTNPGVYVRDAEA